MLTVVTMDDLKALMEKVPSTQQIGVDAVPYYQLSSIGETSKITVALLNIQEDDESYIHTFWNGTVVDWSQPEEITEPIQLKLYGLLAKNKFQTLF